MDEAHPDMLRAFIEAERERERNEWSNADEMLATIAHLMGELLRMHMTGKASYPKEPVRFPRPGEDRAPAKPLSPSEMFAQMLRE